MNNPSENPGEPGKRKSRFFLIAFAVVAGVAIVAALALYGRKPGAAARPGTSNRQAETAGNEPARTNAAASTNGTSGERDAKLAAYAGQLRMMANLSLPTSERRKAAEVLAHDGSEAAVAALKRAFLRGSEDMRVAIAEALGKCGSPECVKWLLELVRDPSVLVARGAARGLAEQDTPEAAGTLVRLLYDSETASDLRSEIASCLGDMNQPGVVQALSDMARLPENDDLATAALNALGRHDFAETEAFFRNYLESPDVASAMRVTALESLAEAKGNPTAFLAQYAAKDSDPDVRTAAAWAMSATEATGNAGAAVLDMLQSENDPDVRLRLYQALGNQESFDTAAALALVKKEADPSALVAGLDLLARALQDNPTPQLQNFFNQTAIAELKQIAMTGETADDRQAAIIALTRAHTPEAMAALGDLAQQIALQKQAAQNAAQAQANPVTAAPQPTPPRQPHHAQHP